MIKDIRHTGIVVDDLEGSLSFYRDLLGLQVSKRLEEAGAYIDKVLGLQAAKVTTIKLSLPNGAMIELLKFHSHPGQEKKRDIIDFGLTHLSMTVDDLDSEYQRLTQKGISFISAPAISPDGYAKVAFCRAPEGTWLELVEVL